MKIVIDIHEKDYQAIKNRQIPSSVFDVIPISVLDVLMKGIPLPKNHGRLIDADALRKNNEEYLIPSPTDREETMQNQMVKWINYDITNAPTIIEADKEDEEWMKNV